MTPPRPAPARPMPGRRAALAGIAATALAGAAPRRARAQERVLNLYSSRHYNTDQALYDDFARQTGIRINRIEAEADALIERMRAEGANSPADVFVSVDAGRIERARAAGLLQPVSSTVLERAVPAHLRDPQGHWFGFSKRARIVVHSRERGTPAEAARYEDLAAPALKGRLAIRSSTAVYNQSLTGSMIAALGEERAEAWCRGVVANLARPPRGGDSDQVRAVAAGEADYGVCNSYYLANMLASRNEADRAAARKVAAIFPNQGDRGTHVNVSGGGVAAHARNRDAAILFLEYLVGAKAQSYFADGNHEYPVVEGVAPAAVLAELGAFREDRLDARVYAASNARALQMMDRAGWK